MGKSTKHEITPYGGRIKTVAEERGYSRERMAELLCYSDVTQISRINSGHKKVTDDRFKILAKEWGLREDYLRCIDDWKTELEKQLGILAEKSFDYEDRKRYLESIGLMIAHSFFWITDWENVYYSYETMYPFITSESIEYINTVIDFSKQEKELDFNKDKEALIELIDNPYPDLLMQLSEVGLKEEGLLDKEKQNRVKSKLTPKSKNRPDGTIEIRCKVYYDSDFIGVFDMKTINMFSNTIDKTCTAIIESIFLSRA